jgi:hypothetical protein
VLVWAAGAALAVGVGLFAVGQVRRQVTDPVSPPLVATDAPTGTTTARPTGPAPTAAPTTRPASSTKTAHLRGGTVGVACDGTAPRLVYATPADDWQLDETEPGTTTLEVRFRLGDARSKLEATCPAGVPVFDVSER